jgi:hypothetical protein
VLVHFQIHFQPMRRRKILGKSLSVVLVPRLLCSVGMNLIK